MNILKNSSRFIIFFLAFFIMGYKLPGKEVMSEVLVVENSVETLLVEMETPNEVVVLPVETKVISNKVEKIEEEVIAEEVNLEAEKVDDSGVMDALDAAIENQLQFARDENELNVVSEEGVVLDEDSKEALTDISTLSEGAPQQSNPLDEESITLEISKSEGYIPKEFEVKRGQAITLVIKSVDDNVHVFRFKDEALSAVAVGVTGLETRAINFNAPTNPGEYEYFSDILEQKNKTGKMIVK